MGDDACGADRAIRSLFDRSNLSADRERALLAAFQSAASEDARHAALTVLWESHAKLVVAIASRFRRAGIDMLDLVGAGHLGLYAAIARYDLSRPERVSSFAEGWIRGAISDHIRRHSGVLRLPESDGYRQLAHGRERLLRFARDACERDGAEPTSDEICARIGLDAGEVARGLALLDGGVLAIDDAPALDAPCGDGPEDDVIQRLDRIKAGRRAMQLADEILGERERDVLLARCLPDREDAVPLEELAERHGVSAARIHQLEASAKRKIAAALMSEGYRAPPEPRSTVRRLDPRPAAAREAAEAFA
jgi:RNA polymerase sigma factor (sigma-70 family)